MTGTLEAAATVLSPWWSVRFNDGTNATVKETDTRRAD
jgi:hypothetical protein